MLDAMAVCFGISVRHRIHHKDDVITVVVSTACRRFYASTRRDSRQNDLGYAALAQVIIQRSAD